MSSRKTCRFLTLAFNIESGSPYRAYLSELKSAYGKEKFLSGGKFAEILQSAINEFYAFDRLSGDLLNCLIGQLLVLASRGKTDRAAQKARLNGTEEVLTAAVNYIDAHFKEIVTLKELSAVTAFSYSTIFRLFSSYYQCTPMDHLAYKKIDYACTLLQSGEWTLDEISEKIGYSSPYNFSRFFKQKTGVSPARWKKSPVFLENPLSEK